ncbi:17756_t:CDS:2, partial [Racocetra fulgida]
TRKEFIKKIRLENKEDSRASDAEINAFREHFQISLGLFGLSSNIYKCLGQNKSDSTPSSTVMVNDLTNNLKHLLSAWVDPTMGGGDQEKMMIIKRMDPMVYKMEELITEIDKLRKENVNIKAKNTRLKQAIEENAKCEAEYEIRIKKLEQSNKENINLKDKDILSTEDISFKNLEQSSQDDSSKQIDLQCDETSVYNIVDNTSNFDEFNDVPDSDIFNSGRAPLFCNNTFLETKPYKNKEIKFFETKQNTDIQEIKESKIDIQSLIQELFLETLKEDYIKIVNIEDSINNSPTIKLVHLFKKISLAEIITIQAKVDKIRSWYKYKKHFEKRFNNLPKNKRNDKRACDLA